jgi:apolipoprotein N-acyltransferase
MKVPKKIDEWKKFLKRQTNSNWFAKSVASFIVGVLAFIPTYILWFFWWLLNPVGFWQTFAVIAGWIAVFGAIQMGFLVIGIILIGGIILDEL